MTGPRIAATLRVALRTLGCRLNQVDTEAIRAGLADGRRVTVVDWDDDADLYILNSCTVTARADQECRRLARQVKRRRPASRLVVVGCFAQTQPDALAAIAEVDGVIGNAIKEDVAAWLSRVLAGERVIEAGDFAPAAPLASAAPASFAGRSRAFLKVQDGCDLRCAYCLIWKARGPARSRPAADVVAQARELHAGGFAEAVLTGVHLGAWGRDLAGTGSRLTDLLDALTSTLPRLRIRLGSLHPDEVTPDLVALLRERRQLRPHLHLSLQSGSDTVLKAMRRPYRADAAAAAIASVIDARPDCGLGADLIAGFPGETEADVEATVRLVESLPFTYLHVFRFSPRPGTPAAAMDGRIAPDDITRRAARLRAAAKPHAERFARGLVGRPREAIVESGQADDAPGWRTATTDNYATVLVPAAATPGRAVTLVPDEWRDGKLWATDLRAATEDDA